MIECTTHAGNGIAHSQFCFLDTLLREQWSKNAEQKQALARTVIRCI